MKYQLQKIDDYKILTIPIEESQIIYVQSYIISGRMNEDKQNSGISHLLEHVLTESWKKCKDDCAKYWGKKGIVTNASTGDTTVTYYVEGLEKNYKEIIEYIIEITTKPHFNKSRIDKEKKAVVEELTREMNDPGWEIANKLSHIFYSHEGLSNGNNIPLQIENLKKLDMKKLINYCKKIYTPKNILFIVSGNFEKKDVLKTFKKYLPKNQKIGTTNLRTNITNNINKPIIYIKNKNNKVAEVVISFISEIFPWEKETILFGRIIDILSGGMQGLLMRRLRTELHFIYNVGVYIEPEITGTLATIETTCDQENVALVVKNIRNVLKDFLDGNWNNEHMTRIKDRFLINDEKVCKNTTFYGNYYGDQFATQIYKKKPKIILLKEQVKYIKNSTKKDIINASKKIFNLNKMVTIYQCKTKQKL